MGTTNGDTAMVFQQYLGLKYRCLVLFNSDLVGDSVAVYVYRGDRKGPVARKINDACLVFSQIHLLVFDQSVVGVFENRFNLLNKALNARVNVGGSYGCMDCLDLCCINGLGQQRIWKQANYTEPEHHCFLKFAHGTPLSIMLLMLHQVADILSGF